MREKLTVLLIIALAFAAGWLAKTKDKPLMAQPTGGNSLPALQIQGPITPGNCVKFLTQTVVGDAGTTC